MPMIPQVDVNTMMPTFLLGVRMGGLMTFAPFLGSPSIPMRVKSGLTFVLTALLAPAYNARLGHHLPENMVATIAGELLIGMGMGMTMELVFDSARFAGQLLGFQFGYSLVNVIDPQSQVEISVLNFFHYTMLLLIFLQGDVHHWLFRLLVHSFDVAAPGTVIVSTKVVSMLLHAAGTVFLLGLQLAAPALLVTVMTDISLSFMSKAAPQLPVMAVGLPAKMLVGYASIWCSVVFWPALAGKWFHGAILGAQHLLDAMHS
jgi:flagellar biosynthesis protein FliR